MGGSIPMTLGDCVVVEPRALVEAATLGSYVHVGEGAVVGKVWLVGRSVGWLAGWLGDWDCMHSLSVCAGCP